MLDAASAQWRSILAGVANLSYDSAYAMVVNTPGAAQEEQVLVVETWVYLYDICKPESTVEQLRQAVRAALSLDPNVTSFGDVDITMLRQGAFYEQAPRVARVDRWTGTVYFEDRIPPGAQIEVYKFTRHPAKSGHDGGTPYPARIGNRFRPDRMLAVGQTSWTVPAMFMGLQRGRNHFRFAYRWPEPPNTPAPAPGVRGPLSPVGLSTASQGERTWGIRALLVPSPRSPVGGV
jgi:hypothetical protein